MRYGYLDLGRQPAGAIATVDLRGSSANVLLLDDRNFANYRTGRPFLYDGGLRRSSPVELEVPRPGHWFVVVDHGGYKGRTRARVRMPSGATRELAAG